MIFAVPTPVPSPSAGVIPDGPPQCANDGGSACAWLWDTTHNAWLAALSSWGGVARIGSIALIVVVAFVARWLIHRAIKRLTRGGSGGSMPTILKPLKERAPEAFAHAAGLLSDRRTQRAQTIGSVLSSISSAVVFGVAVMMILDQLGLNLGPVLASAGVVGLAIGFGAQNLVKDFLSGMFMMLEDQYGVGDVVDVGEASGTVEAVGLRVTTIRDAHGVVWYIRNGEIIRVGNKSQGWAVVNIDVPVPFGTDVERAEQAMQAAADAMSHEEDWKNDVLQPPEALGVEQITGTGLVLRVNVRTTSAGQWRVARELRGRVTEALAEAGIPSGTAPLPVPAPAKASPSTGVSGAT